MTVTSVADLNSGVRTSPFFKAITPNFGQNVNLGSSWKLGVVPDVGVTPPTGVGEVTTSATVGALSIPAPASGNQMYLRSFRASLVESSHASPVLLFDRLVHTSGLVANITTEQAVNSVAVARGTSGEGVLAFMEVYTAIGGTGSTVSMTYTNQDGTTGKVSPTTAFSGGTSPPTGALIPLCLAAGDTGVRSVESVTLGISTGTAGDFGITLARRIASVYAQNDVVTNGFTPSPGRKADFLDCLSPIYEDACLWFVTTRTTGTASSRLMGELGFVDA